MSTNLNILVLNAFREFISTWNGGSKDSDAGTLPRNYQLCDYFPGSIEDVMRGEIAGTVEEFRGWNLTYTSAHEKTIDKVELVDTKHLMYKVNFCWYETNCQAHVSN